MVFLALGGFAGNFVLSLADHTQNGFFNHLEWVPVVAAAAGVGFLLVVVLRPRDAALRTATLWLLGAEVLIGIAGFALHVRADFTRPGRSLLTDPLRRAGVRAAAVRESVDAGGDRDVGAHAIVFAWPESVPS